MVFLRNYTWDGVSHNLDERSLVPITTDFEMDSSMPEVVGKLSADANYKKCSELHSEMIISQGKSIESPVPVYGNNDFC